MKIPIDLSEVSNLELEYYENETWCPQCRKADLGINNIQLYIEDERKYVSGMCRICGSHCVTEIREIAAGSDKLPNPKFLVKVYGWDEGFSKVASDKLIRDTTGWGLKRAKEPTERILADKQIELEFEDLSSAEKFKTKMVMLGGKAKVISL